MDRPVDASAVAVCPFGDGIASPDPFVHLPHLRGRLTPADASGVRVTPAVLAGWDAHAASFGLGAQWRWPDERREADRRAHLAALAPGQDLWVFGYGSLMWDPGVHFAEVRRADLHGWQRRFSYRVPMGRGTRERPALMLALEPGSGCCQGLVFRIAADAVEAESQLLWRREMLRGGYTPTWRHADTPQGPVPVLLFAANPAHADHVGERPLDETAAIIAAAEGPLGRNRDYLDQLAAQLQALGLCDPYLDALGAAVARA
jgi:cation transport protein ChaC